jgi:elongation factor P--(R)-beta-lysine ligase
LIPRAASSGPSRDDFLPTAGWPALRLRDELLRRLRAFFHERAFLEVETPLLSADVVVDRHLDPFAVDISGAGLARQPREGTAAPADRHATRWLQTSPEFAMKRLMAAGGEAIFQVTRAFRRDEQGPLHNPEFTLVEWYRRGDGLRQGIDLLGELCEALLGLGPATPITYQQAFRHHAGIDPHTAAPAELAAVARERRVLVPDSLAGDLSATARDVWLDLLLVELVEPHLGDAGPVILYDYPASQAALARMRPGPPPVAERFELYVRGIELANGYHELLDAATLRERNRSNNALRLADGKPALPEDSRLLAAMDAGLPACTGVALGFDRVVMLASGVATVAEVIAFPFDRA